MLATEQQLILCPGMGDKKVRRLHSALHQPFIKRQKPTEMVASSVNRYAHSELSRDDVDISSAMKSGSSSSSSNVLSEQVSSKTIGASRQSGAAAITTGKISDSSSGTAKLSELPCQRRAAATSSRDIAVPLLTRTRGALTLYTYSLSRSIR
eukprot:gene21934-28014_t